VKAGRRKSLYDIAPRFLPEALAERVLLGYFSLAKIPTSK